VLTRRLFTGSLFALAACTVSGGTSRAASKGPREPAIKGLPAESKTIEPVHLSDAEWKKRLDPQAYYVLREQGTDRAFTGDLWDNHDKGDYLCAGCGLLLFHSADKFASGTGWPSFTRPAAKNRVKVAEDDSFGMTRNEVRCARCGGHQGHVFPDGPPPTGKRWCIDSSSLIFRPT